MRVSGNDPHYPPPRRPPAVAPRAGVAAVARLVVEHAVVAQEPTGQAEHTRLRRQLPQLRRHGLAARLHTRRVGPALVHLHTYTWCRMCNGCAGRAPAACGGARPSRPREGACARLRRTWHPMFEKTRVERFSGGIAPRSVARTWLGLG